MLTVLIIANFLARIDFWYVLLSRQKEKLMANGFTCKYCGWQESDHERGAQFAEQLVRQKGYKKLLRIAQVIP